MARLSVLFADDTFWDGPCMRAVWAEIDAACIAVTGYLHGRRVVRLRVIACEAVVQ